MPIVVDPNAVMKFVNYEVEDTGIRFFFDCQNPGPGRRVQYTVFATDAELSGVTTQPQLQSLLVTKLQRSIRQAGIASKLDALLNQTLTIP